MKRKNQRLKTEDRKPKLGFAKKSLGQNFLVDENYIERIVSSLSLTTEDTVIEIGPGRGALTEHLIDSGCRVIAIEIDDNLAPHLRDKFSENENFSIIHGDALGIDFQTINDSPAAINNYKLVANLPYYISTAILQRLIEQRQYFSQLVLMLQREVVDRITAEPGESERGFLTVMVEAYLDAEKLFDVPPEAFRPRPKVWSSIVELLPRAEDAGINDEKLFREIIAAGFAYKRKTILNNIKNAPPNLKERFGDASSFLQECEIDSQRRAETLTLEEWLRIEKAV